jgi:hypothetical protein
MGNSAATAYKYLFSWRGINGKGRPNMPLYFAIRAEFYLRNALCRYILTPSWMGMCYTYWLENWKEKCPTT